MILKFIFKLVSYEQPYFSARVVWNNLGPKKSSFVEFCYWNLNGLEALGLFKIPLLEAFCCH